jgi:hypothetical protein
MNGNNVGVSDYGGGRSASDVRARALLGMIRKKIELKTALSIETGKIMTAMAALSAEESADLMNLLAAEGADLDADVEALRTAVSQIVKEEAQAAGVQPMNKGASKILQTR